MKINKNVNILVGMESTYQATDPRRVISMDLGARDTQTMQNKPTLVNGLLLRLIRQLVKYMNTPIQVLQVKMEAACGLHEVNGGLQTALEAALKDRERDDYINVIEGDSDYQFSWIENFMLSTGYTF